MVEHVSDCFLCYVLLVEIECIGSAELAETAVLTGQCPVTDVSVTGRERDSHGKGIPWGCAILTAETERGHKTSLLTVAIQIQRDVGL